MRAWWLAALLTAPLLAGCLSFLEEDDTPDDGLQPAPVPEGQDEVVVTGFVEHAVDVLSFDNTSLSAVVYEPTSPSSLADGSPPTWPVVVFLHPWTSSKEYWSDLPVADQGNDPSPRNLLEEFALEGMIAVAYDARGFAQSEGESTIAGPNEMEDLDAVLDHVESAFPTNGFVGLAGTSYGGGQAMLAWATNPRVTTAAVHQGWTDLRLALMPGNVPKLAWSTTLFGSEAVTGQARYSPIAQHWYENTFTRDDMDNIAAQMALRSAAGRAQGDKPLYICDAMQDTLMMQYGEVLGTQGFLRARIHEGGHLSRDDTCWDETKDWMLFFLAGRDTGVPGWSALATVDALGDQAVSYDDYPDTTQHTLYLRNGDLADAAFANATFTISQRVVGNPFEAPDVLGDIGGGPFPVPEQFRQDPTAEVFRRTFEGPSVLVGAPTLTLQAQDPNTTYQVVAGLELVRDGQSMILGKAAYASLDDGDNVDGAVVLRFPWTRTNIHPGDTLVLDIASNDPGDFMPLDQNYAVTFTGDSHLVIDRV